MLNLDNAQLIIEIIDPVLDKRLLGSRYCTAGSIHQISDRQKGCLLAGPTFGSGAFNAFDGQGAPEVFLMAPGEDGAKVGDDVLVPGVGRVNRSSAVSPFHSRDNPCVSEFTSWNVESAATEVSAHTRQAFRGYDIAIERRVTLAERTVTSATKFCNAGAKQLDLRWFPHPFFPPTIDGVACRFDFPVSLPDDSGYFVNELGWLELKRDYDWTRGLYQPLGSESREPFSAVVNHPLVEFVEVKCDYTPAFLPVWANHRTFSFEPYLERTVKSGEEESWKIEYTFGC
jgi:hypothetical protein